MLDSIAPRQPKLLTAFERCDSAEMSVSGNKKRSNKSVQFNEIVSIRSTTHVNDMTDAEIFSAWYTRKEMGAIKRGIASDAKIIAMGMPLPANSTRRGLEFRTPTGSAKRKANKFNSIHAVLDEQDTQHMRNLEDADTLREIYLQHSTHCLAEARQLGMQDEIEAQNLLKEPENMEIDEEQTRRTTKKEMILRTFAKKSEVVDEIKQLRVRV